MDGIEYAIKVSKNQFRGASQKSSMLKEVLALAALADNLSTPHIVRYQNAWCEDHRLYIQMELCDECLEGKLYGPMASGPLPAEELTLFTRHMLLALDAVHSLNVVHLDIKPGNIFIKGGLYKLGDL